jgi:hypothetical protein
MAAFPIDGANGYPDPFDIAAESLHQNFICKRKSLIHAQFQKDIFFPPRQASVIEDEGKVCYSEHDI